MGLSQRFRFGFRRDELVECLQELGVGLSLEVRGDRFVFSADEGEAFEFEAAIEESGLYTHRSGAYLPFLGRFIEGLTGRFGKVEVEDA